MSAPQKLASIVNTFGIYNSRHIVTLAVCSFAILLENLQSSKLKKSQSLDSRKGKSLVEWGASEKLLPYMKTFLFQL